MLLVDLMHEFELGVWKALFIHLLRILTAVSKNLVHELDRRWVLPPTEFGKWNDSIASTEMKVSDKFRHLAVTLSDGFQGTSQN
jgi:hypothetical protein